MAAALFNALARERGLDWTADSAGTEPAERVHPEVVAVMAELGIDLSGVRPRLLTNEDVEVADRVITTGCEVDAGVCPAVFIKNVGDWGLPDRKGRSPAEVRQIRDEVRRRVEALFDELARQPV
jgi:protein-tyrosine-phosphatase